MNVFFLHYFDIWLQLKNVALRNCSQKKKMTEQQTIRKWPQLHSNLEAEQFRLPLIRTALAVL